ncbi:MAG: hypothetical protein LKJ90_01320 [Faecalibacterium sp.]|jgi:hypothetical protein|nr:hypothetical protein [Faecalibacterium sp.]
MRSDGTKAFWKAFAITLAVLTPVMILTALATQNQRQPAASSKSDVPVASPTAENQMTVLAVVADDPPAFVLVRMDAMQNRLEMAVIPPESVVKNGQETFTLAESYAAAGPARAAELLSSTLGIPIERYLAATPAVWAEAISDAGTARVGLSGAMTPGELSQMGMSGEVREWTPSAAHAFLHRLDGTNAALAPTAAASARAALWQGWARQKLEKLPAVLPDGLRSQSAALLTNLSATDLLTMEQTLEFLANNTAEPNSQVLPGNWNAAALRYEFNDDTLAALQALASAPAASAASSGSNEP